MKTVPNLKSALKDGRETGKNFDGSAGRDYTPDGPLEFHPRDGDSPDMVLHCKCMMAENAVWWKGFNETCHPTLRREDI